MSLPGIHTCWLTHIIFLKAIYPEQAYFVFPSVKVSEAVLNTVSVIIPLSWQHIDWNKEWFWRVSNDGKILLFIWMVVSCWNQLLLELCFANQFMGWCLLILRCRTADPHRDQLKHVHTYQNDLFPRLPTNTKYADSLSTREHKTRF